MTRDRLRSVWAAAPSASAADAVSPRASHALPVRVIDHARSPIPATRRGHAYTASDATLGPAAKSPSFAASVYSHDEAAPAYIDESIFFEDLGNVQSLTADLGKTIDRLVQLQTSSLTALPDSSAGQQLAADTEAHVQRSRGLMQEIKACIHELERTNGRAATAADAQVKRSHTAAAKAKFLDAANRLARAQADHRAAVRSRLSRQVRVVDPSISDSALQQAITAAEAGQGNVFMQAMSSSNRSAEARRTLDAVAARQKELASIESTMVELAQLFQDMAMQVEEQHGKIVAIEEKAISVESDMAVAHADLKQATGYARSARKRRICCFVIFIVILLVAGGIAAIVLVPRLKAANANASPSPQTQDVTVDAPASALASLSTPRSATTTVAGASSSAVPARSSIAAASTTAAALTSVATGKPSTVTVTRSLVSTVYRTVSL